MNPPVLAATGRIGHVGGLVTQRLANVARAGALAAISLPSARSCAQVLAGSQLGFSS